MHTRLLRRRAAAACRVLVLVLAATLLYTAPANPQRPPADIQVRPIHVDSLEVRTALARTEVREALRRADPGITIDYRAVEAHVIRPAHVAVPVSDEGRRRRPPTSTVRALEAAQVEAVLSHPDLVVYRPGRIRVPAPSGPQLDVNAFGAALHEALKDSVAGYMMQLRQNGQTILNFQWNLARRASDGGPLGWNADRRMHIASVSKLVTAMALVRVLHDQGISVDTSIRDFLPAYWSVGPNIGQITFRHLLTHGSGIRVQGGATDYWTMRQKIAEGVNAGNIGQNRYENTNFGLMRILIPILNGADRTFLAAFAGPMGSSPSWIDQIWDVLTVASYADYVQKRVFAPAGITGPRLQVQPGDALAYGVPSVEAGWNSGNLVAISGGAGWVMSVDEVLRVMGEFRRGGGVVPASIAQQALDDMLGIDVREETAAGWVYNKNGRWHDRDPEKEPGVRAEQSLAYFLPQNMELVVFTNSPVGRQDLFFRGLVTAIYENNLK